MSSTLPGVVEAVEKLKVCVDTKPCVTAAPAWAVHLVTAAGWAGDVRADGLLACMSSVLLGELLGGKVHLG